MRALLIILIALAMFSCAMEDEKVEGKWYTYADNGDYMELWIGEDKAMSYLSGIDEFLLYDLAREGGTLSFSLIESRVINKHQFDLIITNQSEELLQTIFSSDTKVDSLKTYFLISNEAPVLEASLKENRENMEELFSRLDGSHAGHDH